MKTQTKFYNSYWKNKNLETVPKFRFIMDLIKDNSTVLEIGCGDGTLLKMLKDEKNCNVVGIDISNVAAEKARENGIDVIVSNIEEKIPISEKFDYIVCADVLEHLYFPERFLKKIKPFGKYFFFVTPNACWWRCRLMLLKGEVKDITAFKQGQHLYHWSYNQFKKMLEENGYKLLKEKAISGVPLVGFISKNLSRKLAQTRKNLFYMAAIQLWE